MTNKLILISMLLICLLVTFDISHAKVVGPCVNCHTMHNSQSGTSMISYVFNGESTSSPLPYLLRGTCLGCHAMNTANRIETLSGSQFPQVYHKDGAGDLAGGNFAYIDGTKGSGAASSKGHNVIDIFSPNSDTNLNNAPGTHSGVTDGNLTCAGKRGCHGWRVTGSTGLNALRKAHHGNVDGKLDTASTVANSYRFLFGVKGLENPIWQNINENNHNEYFGASSPHIGDYNNCNNCHASIWLDPPGVLISVPRPASKTISGFCGSCHGEFHFTSGIGGDISSPFTRHPTDVIINTQGPSSEYANYTVYDITVPVGRTSVPDTASNVVDPSNDTVICLSCHMAHGSDYSDILRWDYSASPVTLIKTDLKKS
jgi:hypothetical protein